MKQLLQWILASGVCLAFSAVLTAQSPNESASPGASVEAKKSSSEQSGRAAHFRRMDKNGDGFITADEVRNQERFKRLLGVADTNKDGKISREEFMNAHFSRGSHAGQSSGATETRAQGSANGQSKEARFERMDKNNDGVLTQDEARNPERFKRLEERADTNNDGKITKEEFMNAGRPHRGAKANPSASPAAASSPATAASASPSASP